MAEQGRGGGPRVKEGSPVRFAVAAAAGAAVDYAAAYVLLAAGMPKWLSLGAGFLIGAAILFFLHETWTFGRAKAQRRGSRIVKLVLVSALVLAVRWLVVAGLDRDLSGVRLPTWLALGAAFCASMAVNYLATRFLVYGRKAEAG